jgi:hypothetical protein
VFLTLESVWMAPSDRWSIAPNKLPERLDSTLLCDTAASTTENGIVMPARAQLPLEPHAPSATESFPATATPWIEIPQPLATYRRPKFFPGDSYDPSQDLRRIPMHPLPVQPNRSMLTISRFPALMACINPTGNRPPQQKNVAYAMPRRKCMIYPLHSPAT